MPRRSLLRPTPITRRDGVATTVWRKDPAESGTQPRRLLGIKLPSLGVPSAPKVNAFDMAMDFDASNPAPVAQPKWWEKYVSDTEENPDPAFACTPELLDVISSPVGDLAVVWEPVDAEQNHIYTKTSGYDRAVLHFKSMKTGKRYGYLKVHSITDESFERSFGNDEFTPFRAHQRFDGLHYPNDLFLFDEDDIRRDFAPTSSIEEIRRGVWQEASRSLRKPYQVIPDDETVKRDLVEYGKIITERANGIRSFALPEAPYIDFSRVDDELKGQGFGKALYVYGAKRLAADGKALGGSGVQSDEAEALWNRLSASMPERFSYIDRNDGTTAYRHPILDFRE